MPMNNQYLPYAGYTDEELLRTLYVMDKLTAIETELMHRLDRARDTIKDLEEELGDNA